MYFCSNGLKRRITCRNIPGQLGLQFRRKKIPHGNTLWQILENHKFESLTIQIIYVQVHHSITCTFYLAQRKGNKDFIAFSKAASAAYKQL